MYQHKVCARALDGALAGDRHRAAGSQLPSHIERPPGQEEDSAGGQDVNMFHVWPEYLRRAFEDEVAYLDWGANLRLAQTSVVTVPLYTLADRQTIASSGEGTKFGQGRSGCRRKR